MARFLLTRANKTTQGKDTVATAMDKLRNFGGIVSLAGVANVCLLSSQPKYPCSFACTSRGEGSSSLLRRMADGSLSVVSG